jgi:hypothetical protein
MENALAPPRSMPISAAKQPRDRVVAMLMIIQSSLPLIDGKWRNSKQSDNVVHPYREMYPGGHLVVEIGVMGEMEADQHEFRRDREPEIDGAGGEVIRRIAQSQSAGDDSDVDFTDIPRLTAEQLANMVRRKQGR